MRAAISSSDCGPSNLPAKTTAKATTPLFLKGAGEATLARVEAQQEMIRRLARVESVELLDGEVPNGAVQIVIDETTAATAANRSLVLTMALNYGGRVEIVGDEKSHSTSHMLRVLKGDEEEDAGSEVS